MTIVRTLTKALRLSLVLWLLVAVIYPLIILGVGQTVFPKQANGTIVQNLQGQPIGSELIGQLFRSDKYFHGRPSTVRYSQGKKAQITGISGASNLAPSNPDLLNRVVEEANKLQEDNIKPLPDLIYTSASGLDPHISRDATGEQLERVARARGVRPDEIYSLINKYTEDRFLKIFGEPGVNILRLNYALDLRDVNPKQ